MLSLHKTKTTVRLLTKWGGIIGGSIFLLIILLRIGVFVYGIIFPPPPELPDTKFGKLPAITFGESLFNQPFTYTIDTITGELPTFPDRATVYKTITPPLTLQNAQEADFKAASIGFVDFRGVGVPHEVYGSNKVYRWKTNTQGLSKTLVMNIQTYNYQYLTSFLSQNATSPYLANETNAKNAVEGFMYAIRNIPTDINKDKTRIEMFTITNGTLIPATRLSQAQIMRVDLYQNDINELPVYYPRYPKSTMNFLVTLKSDKFDSVVEANFIHHAINIEEKATYPIKTAQQAVEELSAGKAHVTNYNGTGTNITVNDITLGYFASEKPQQYLLPVFVFHGKGDFYAFLSAIDDSWFEANLPNALPTLAIE